MLGFAHPDQLLGQLSSKEITEWRAYDRLEPIDKEEFGWATLCSVVSNIAISIYGKKGSKYTAPTDFLPEYENTSVVKEKKEQTVEEQKKLLLMIVSIQNKRVKKNG